MTEDVTSPPTTSSAPSREPVEARLADWTRKLDRFLEQADRSVAIGRELVEQRALNIDLQRQIHRLEDEVQSLRSKLAAGSSQTSGFAREGQDGLATVSPGSDGDRSSLGRWIRRAFGR